MQLKNGAYLLIWTGFYDMIIFKIKRNNVHKGNRL